MHIDDFERINNFMFEYDEAIRSACESKYPAEIVSLAIEVANEVFDHNDYIDNVDELCKRVLNALNFSDFCEFFNLDEQTENTLRGMFEQVKKEANEMDKYESYRVLNNLDSDIDSDRDWKDIQYWINALCDGEYLSMYDYSEEAVNSAVESLERLNHHTFMLFDLGVLVAEGSFAEIIDILFDEYPSDNASTLSIRIQGPYADDFIIRDATPLAVFDALNILQLITFYQL